MSDFQQLGHQSLGRPLTEQEQALASAMLKAFGAGDHDFAVMAERLQAWSIARPSGDPAPWTLESLEAELQGINASLDQAYAEHGTGG